MLNCIRDLNTEYEHLKNLHSGKKRKGRLEDPGGEEKVQDDFEDMVISMGILCVKCEVVQVLI